MKILKESEISNYIGEKCYITIEQGPNFSPFILTDRFEALFYGFSTSNQIKVKSKIGEILIDIEKCKEKQSGRKFVFSGKNGDIIINF